MKRLPGWTVFVIVLIGLVVAQAAMAKDTLVVDLVNEPASLDPHVQWNPDSYYVYRNIFDNLLTRDNSGKIVGMVATSWKYISDTVVEFKIRDDIKFQDGTPLTAADVVYSVKRITDPTFNSPQLGQFNEIVGAEAVDDHTVRLTTNGPYPVLLAQLTKLSIVPEHIVEKEGNQAFGEHPVGSGPYVFKSWQRGVQVTLTANPDYWGGTPPFKTIEFHAVPDVSTRVADLVSGRADLVVSLTPDQAAQLEHTAGVKILSVPTERVAYVLFNTLRKPTDNIDVRRGLAESINPQLLVDSLLKGYGKVTHVMLTPAHFGYSDAVKPFQYNLDDAKKAREAAGNIGPIEYYTAPVYNQNVVQAIQQMARQAGFDVQLVMQDMPTHLKVLQGDPQKAPNMTFDRWSCGCQDADGVLYPLFDSHSPWSKVRDPQLDKVLEAARNTVDSQKREDLYKQALQIIRDKVLALPLYQVSVIYGAKDPLQWQPTPGENMYFMRMTWQ